MGYPVTFVRMYGCNLNCSFCDTPYSRSGNFEEMTPDELVCALQDFRPNFVVFTGGEPTLQIDELKVVISALRKIKPSIAIALETNGTTEFDHSIFDVVVVSPKSMSVISRWSHVPNVYMKFLASDEHDMENIIRHIWMNIFANMPYVMPIGVDAEGIKATSKRIADVIFETGMDVILTPRLHVLMEMK